MRMHGYRRTVYVVLLLFLLLPATVRADLGDFAEEAEKEDREESEKTPGRDHRNQEDNDSDDDGGFFDFLASVTFLLWYYHNGSSWYPDYPYEYGSQRPAAVGHDWETENRRARFSFTVTGGVFFEGQDIGPTGSAAFRSMTGGIIGGDLEYRIWNDNAGTLHYLAPGITVPFIQHDFFTLSTYLGAGFLFDSVNAAGFRIGGEFTMYPFRPLSLEVGGGALVTEGADYAELKAALRWHINRYAVRIGYYGLFVGSRVLHSAEAGIGVYF